MNTAPPSPYAAPTLAGALGLAILCLWPLLLVPGPFVFFDSFAYDAQGEAGLGILSRALFSGEGSVGIGSDGDAPRGLRSAAWSVSLALLGGLRWGGAALAMLQTAATLYVLSALVPTDTSRRALFAGGLPLAVLSGLPWYASYAMPDMLGALVIAYYAVLLGPFPTLGRGHKAAFALLATYAILGHYGHLPLAAGLAVLVVGFAVLARRAPWRVTAAAVGPLALAVLVNVGTGLIFDASVARAAPGVTPPAAPSLAPGRLPILLARSIEDGPGRLHLRAACAEDRYRSCAFLPPDAETVGEILWSPDGFASTTAAERAILRQEEMRIVVDAALAYPAMQAAALVRNASRQLMRVGIDDHYAWTGRGPEARKRPLSEDGWREGWHWRTVDAVLPILTGGAAILLVLTVVTGRLARPLRAPVLIAAAGLVANAAIYGGLSYPVDRYGGRVAWLIPAFLALAIVWIGQRRHERRALQAGR